MKRPCVAAGAGGALTTALQEPSPDRPGWSPFFRNWSRVHCTCPVSFSEKRSFSGAEGWSPFLREGIVSPWSVVVLGARGRVEYSAFGGVGRSWGSAWWQHEDYEWATECQVYDDYQCECGREQWKHRCMSGVFHVSSLLSGVCVSDLPIVPCGDRIATPECVVSVSTLRRKKHGGGSNAYARFSAGRATNDRRATR
jgi:hypothetical protein